VTTPTSQPSLAAFGAQPIRSLGLTGGIGSGKSTVARLLVQAGAWLVDTDAIAHQLTQAGGRGIAPIRAQFGAQALDATGALDRERMRQLVFADAPAKQRLEAILHPLIGQVASEQAALAAGRTVVFDVPLLGAASRWRTNVERVLVVDCSAATQAERVAQRPGWTPEAALRVINQQMPRQARRALADAVIFNDSTSMAALANEVAALLVQWPLASPAAASPVAQLGAD
jgi:dephospho-CoA kinase